MNTRKQKHPKNSEEKTMPEEKKIYTQAQMDSTINAVRIEERYIANQLMGDLGIPAERRIAPNGQPIYTGAADIIMRELLAVKKKEEGELPTPPEEPEPQT